MTASSRILPPLSARVAPLLVLFCLAPFIGEFLLGNVPGTWLWALPILAPLYGGGAILVREIAVRGGLGWWGVLSLGLAYGLVEAGLIDQSLFNPDLLETGAPGATYIPGLGVTVADALAYLVGHAIWSIGLSIAFTQFLFPKVADVPWLGMLGWVLTMVLYLLGCWVILSDVIETGGFIASRAQHAGALVAALAAVALAFLPCRPAAARCPPSPIFTGMIGFALASAMVIASETWGGVVAKLALLAFGAWLVMALSQHEAWTPRHSIALSGGILLTYGWLGPVLTTLLHAADPLAYLWNAVFAGVAAILILLSLRQTSVATAV